MNKEIKVIKIKKEDGKELDVNWILDLGKRCIKKSSIDRKVFFELFNLKSFFSFSDIQDLNLILYFDNCLYYCNNCIFGFNINTNGELLELLQKHNFAVNQLQFYPNVDHDEIPGDGRLVIQASNQKTKIKKR